MAGFILALQLRRLYNYCYNPSAEHVQYGEEAWPSTHWKFMLLVPLAGTLQLIINELLANFGRSKNGRSLTGG